jgi:hypothetical protein
MSRHSSLLALAAGLIAAVGAVSAIAQTAGPLTYDAGGAVVAPANYRDWVFLSSGLDMTYSNPAPTGEHRFDNVFVDPAAYKGFLATGQWPDRTVMVLEVRKAAQNVSINKAGFIQGDIVGVQLHVKDKAKGGWAFYSVGAGGKTSRFSDKSTCRACHESSGSVDGTFIQFYPTLIDAAKTAGTYKDGK